MKDIDKLIAEKEATIARLRDEIKALKGARKIVESVSRVPATRRPGGKPRRLQARGRAARGAKKARVLLVMTAKPQRMRDIAEKAGMSTPEAASILQSGVKRGEFKKGRRRGTYLLVK
ncbi:MAG: hypothetical protein LJF15_04040 [Acidobacteria bacterium]|jgi:hypothetical protein|nr:hypothetical protein [Acidobacteriota bacterium]